jgi:phospholipid/cholesterol/gamma-HCH transport system permease protein
MRVTEQVDALSTIGVDPIRKLVTPRFLAAIIMMPMLTMVTDLLAIFGGLLIAITKLNLSTDLYMRSVYSTLSDSGFVFRYMPVDVLAGAIIKPVVFGAVMALTGCFYGLRTTGGTEGVGRSTTRAVVTSSILILALDYFLTQIIIVLFIE